jgi:uncharacterized repeat protein (TIGR02543 family)
MVTAIHEAGRRFNQMRRKHLLKLLVASLMLAWAGSALAQVWTAANAPSANWISIAYSTNGDKVVAVDLYNAIYLSTNFGFDWTLANLPRTNWTSVACSADGNEIFATVSRDDKIFPFVPSRGPIYISKDSGLTWMQSSAPITNWSSVACSADGKTVLAAGGNDFAVGPLFISRDSGASWTEVNTWDYEWDSVAMSSDGQTMIARSGPSNFVSTNAGVTWEGEGTGGDFTGPDGGASSYVFSAGSADKMHWVGFQACASLYTSDDDGTNWVQVPDSGGLWQKVGASPNGAWRIAMEGNGRTWISYVPESAPWFLSQPVAATNAYEDKAITLKASALGSAPMAFQWQLNGVNLSDDARITGSGTDQLTISNLQVSDSGIYTLTVTNRLGATNSLPTVLTVNADVQRPMVAITTPAPGDKLKAVTFQATGVAVDNSQVTAVWYKVNSGAWTLAQTTDGWNSWYANFSPTNGSNTISAYAVDQVGNASFTNAVTFSVVLQSLMFVRINGQGKVSPNYNWKALNVGSQHTVTAMPGKGYVFAGWTGDLQSSAPKLSFTVTNEFSVQANFVPNPFLAASGEYVGTLFNTNIDQPPISGTLTVRVLKNGTYAATIHRLHFSGKFSADGTATKLIPQKDQPPISVQLQLDLNGGNVLNATFTQAESISEISANKISK